MDAALARLTASSLEALAKIESPPRGLVLVVGCVGVLTSLADELPLSWEGCQAVLGGVHARVGLLRRAPKAHGGRRTLLERLQAFDAHALTDAQREAVLAAIKDDLGGLMAPRHMERVSRAAHALAEWLEHAVEQLQRPPPRREEEFVQFLAPRKLRCATCGRLMEAALHAEHEPLCARRAGAIGAAAWESELSDALRSDADEKERRLKDARPAPQPPAAPAVAARRPPPDPGASQAAAAAAATAAAAAATAAAPLWRRNLPRRVRLRRRRCRPRAVERRPVGVTPGVAQRSAARRSGAVSSRRKAATTTARRQRFAGTLAPPARAAVAGRRAAPAEGADVGGDSRGAPQADVGCINKIE